MSNDSQMQAGIAAFKAGDKAGARAHFMKVVEADENNEQAWLWLAGAMDDPAETRICLENVLHLNPANQRAAQGLEWLRKQHPAVFVEPEPAPPAYSPLPATEGFPGVPAATGPTVALSEAAPAAHGFPGPPSMTGPTIALGQPAAQGVPAYRAPAPAPPAAGYSVPSADGTPSLSGVADPQPCPRCGKPTRLAQRRCRSCGFSLMQKTGRPTGSKAMAVIPGVMSLLHEILTVLSGLGIIILITTLWSRLKNAATAGIPPEQRAAYMAELQPMLDEIYDRAIEPILTGGVIVMIIGGFGITFAIGIIRLRPWAYWAGLVYNTLLWLSYLALFVYIDRITAFLEPILMSLPSTSARPGQVAQIITFVRGIGVFPALYFTILIVFLAFSWRLFTRGSARFVAMDPPSGDPADHFNRGIAYRRQGMWYQSMVEWERAVELSPSDPTYRHALGLVYAQLKRPAEAQRELAEALSLDPNNMAIMQDAQKLGVSV